MPVVRSHDFQRIANLPRRPETIDEEACLLLTKHLAQDFDTLPEDRYLRPTQCRGLFDAADYGGALDPVDTGEGKFLLSVLIFTLRPHLERPLLFVPANLKAQTLDEIDTWSEYYRIRSDIRVESFSKLSVLSGAEMLADYQPDGIVCDEAHKFKHPKKSARSKRLRNYLKLFPGTECYFMSGSFSQESIMEYHHLMLWALGAKAPMPLGWHEAKTWSQALDETVPQGRIGGGALWDLCTPEERRDGSLKSLRAGYRRRLTETPGVVASESATFDKPLVVKEVSLELPPSVRQDFQHLRETWETPGGEEIESPMQLYRHSRELAVGFYYKWDPPPPRPWLQARKEWHRFVRDTLGANVEGIESPLQVALACSDGHLDDYYYRQWVAVRDTYRVESVPVWRDRFAVDFAEQWALENNGIVWVSHKAIGAAFNRIPYFGGGKAGDAIRKHRGPCAASINAHGTGKNLTQWAKALVLSPPSGGGMWQQVLARLHRPGQASNEVEFSVVLNSAETYEAFQRARGQSQYTCETLPSSQKLQQARVMIDPETEKRAREKRLPEWAKG